MTPSPVSSDISLDWRKSPRRPLALEVRFRYRSGNVNYVGTGRTVNLGGETVCFEVDQAVAPKGEIELRVFWPVRLQDVCDLELVIRGKIIRSKQSRVVIQVASYEFQTLGSRSFNEAASSGITCDIAA